MPYIGNELAAQFQAFETQTITGDGSTGYTLDRAVANGKELLVYINNVKQEEGSGKSYTASGTTITFSEAVASTDSCYVVYMGLAMGTITAPDGSIVSTQLANANLEMPNTLDMNGKELILDADADTSITADTDDRVDIKVGGTDRAVFLANNLHLAGGTVARVQLSSSGAGSAAVDNNTCFVEGNDDTLVLNAAANGHIIFQENNSERMRIHTGGNVSVGVNSITSGGFSADTRMVIQSAGSGGETLGIRSTSSSGTSLEMVVFRDGDDTQIGTIVGNASANTTSYGTSSDYRLKENVVDVDKPIEKLKKLKPKTFNMISDPDNKLDGFLAHELGEVIPNATHGVKDAVNEDGSIKPQQVDYGLITPLLTAALQEAVAKIETLEAKVTALEGG